MFDDEDSVADMSIDGQDVREDVEEQILRRERSGEVAKELSDLVNYCEPFR